MGDFVWFFGYEWFVWWWEKLFYGRECWLVNLWNIVGCLWCCRIVLFVVRGVWLGVGVGVVYGDLLLLLWCVYGW